MERPRPTTSAGWNPRRDLPVVLLVLLINVLLVSTTLMRGFDSISPYDEAKYIDSGRSLTRLEIRGLDWGPLVAVVYAPVHLVVGSSPDWFMIEAWTGSVILFVFLWLSIFYLGTRFAPHAHPFILAGVLFVSTSFFPTIENQSDALFLGFSAFALGKVLAFAKSGSLRDLAIASVLAGLACLSRAEAILLVGVLPAIAILLPSSRPWFQRAAVSAAPLLAVLALYAIASRASTGEWGIGFSSKSWDSFEVNQPVAAGTDPRSETHRIFGTGEENDFSVVRAVLRHPEAFIQRVAIRLAGLPDEYLAFFGKRVGAAIAFFTAWGVGVLVRRREWTFLWVSLLWTIPTATSLLFLTRHFVPQVSYFPLVLAPVGLALSVSPDATRNVRLGIVVSMLVVALYSILDDKPAFLYAMGMILAATAIVWLLRDRLFPSPRSPAVPLLLALTAGLILRGPFNVPGIPNLGASPSEQAVHYLQAEIPAGANIVAFEPILPLASGMEQRGAPALVSLGDRPDRLCRWFSDNAISAIVVNGQLRANHDDVVTKMEQMIGQGIEVGFVSDPATTEVFLVTDPCR